MVVESVITAVAESAAAFRYHCRLFPQDDVKREQVVVIIACKTSETNLSQKEGFIFT
jgi:hypothetical protein